MKRSTYNFLFLNLHAFKCGISTLMFYSFIEVEKFNEIIYRRLALVHEKSALKSNAADIIFENRKNIK